MTFPRSATPALPAGPDASNRAWRTLGQGLLTDVGIALVPLLIDAMSNADLFGTSGYWKLLGVSLAKTAVMTALAYVMRRLKPPPTG